MRIPQWFVLAWVVTIALVAVGASAFSYTFVRDFAADADELLELPDPPQLGGNSSDSPDEPPAPTDNPPAAVADAAPTDSGGDTAGEPAAGAENPPPDGENPPEEPTGDSSPTWDDPRRVTVLLLGIDQRAGEEGVFPTDTMIMISMDPVGNTGALLSIPRDLWVDFPGLNQPGRINSANILGDEINYPGGGGPALAVKTVERNLGVRIDYYVLINFEVFTTLIDVIGPIEVCPPEPIDDDHYPDGSYGYITIHFDAGCQELDSERLLQYARTRHSDSDIGRSSRQQEVILAVRHKVLSTGGVMALLPQAPALWESVQANIRTNLTFEDMVGLALKAEEIPPDNIRQDQIAFEEVYLSTTPDGDSILIPIGSDIRQLIEELFRPPGSE